MILGFSEENLYYKGLYKFYVNKDLLDKLIGNLINSKQEKGKKCINFSFENFMETVIYNNKIYYCVYIGETSCKTGFSGRIINNHLKETKRSILRKKLLEICDNKSEDALNKLLNNENECLFYVFPIVDKDNDNNKIKKTIKDLEKVMINSSLHILNVQNNDFFKKIKKLLNVDD